MQKKYRILFSAPGAYGHVGPSLAIAKHLLEWGHTIGYCSGNPIRKAVEKAGVHRFFSRDTYHTIVMNDKILGADGMIKLWCDASKVYNANTLTKCFQELINAFEEFQPDVVYIDFYMNL